MQKNYDNIIELIGDDNLNYDRLLKNARQALKNTKTEWGKNYWKIVIAQLKRKSKQNNKMR
tara:strand:- start:45 stop:227 length:183 start_codon:yes stop_codon:yes gene_type:complete